MQHKLYSMALLKEVDAKLQRWGYEVVLGGATGENGGEYDHIAWNSQKHE